MAFISASVGAGGVNNVSDVKVIQGCSIKPKPVINL